MTNLDRMNLISLTMKSLAEAVRVYETEKKEQGGFTFNIEKHCSKEAIKRRVTQIRQDLLLLEKEL